MLRSARDGGWVDLFGFKELPDGTVRSEIQPAAVPGLLEERFGLPGFVLDGG